MAWENGRVKSLSEVRMEGSSSGKTKPVSRPDPKVCFERAGLPVKLAVAWHKSGFRVTGNFKRDIAGAANTGVSALI